MASIKLASFLQSLSGSIGDIVFYNRYGREYARVYVTPANPNTGGQRFMRKTFGDAVRAWQALPREDKERYDRQARKLVMSGYNLFISRYMKRNIAGPKGIAAYQGAFGGRLPVHMKATPSVPAPFHRKNCFPTAFISPGKSPGTG